MTEEEFYQVLDRYMKNVCSDEERKLIEDFIERNVSKPSITATWSNDQKNAVASHIKGRVLKDIRARSSKPKPKFNYKWIASAAAVLVIAVCGYLIMGERGEATEISYLTRSTEKGQKLKLMLNDGTIVQLNSESTITYPEKFELSRNVKLSGEAFFQVSKDPSKPFIVNSGGINTHVLGTSFNVKAYPDDKDIHVTVVSGKVRVVAEDVPASSPVLIKGQQASYIEDQGILEWREVELAPYLNWKDGILQFDDISLIEVLKLLERWYGVEFEYENKRTLESCFVSNTYQDESLENVLESLSFIVGLKYEFLDKKRILISSTQCNE